MYKHTYVVVFSCTNCTNYCSTTGVIKYIVLVCGASEVRKLGEEVEKSFANLDYTIRTIAIHTARSGLKAYARFDSINLDSMQSIQRISDP